MNQELLRARKAKLDQVKAELKTELFGLDNVIDQVFNSIKTWYLIPEIVTRPVIINLFGMTGTGKTQLVRSLTEKLDFKNKFLEVQMDESGNSYTKIRDLLKESQIEEGAPGIVLLDEFQRYRTVGAMGADIKQTAFQDVWHLLSDGKFPIDPSLFNVIQEALLDSEYGHERWQKAPQNETFQYKTSAYAARTFKKLFLLKESVRTIMTWDEAKILEIKRSLMGTGSFGDFSKCLIFICGNLDEAFSVSGSVQDCDTDADIFHEFSKKISVSKIKTALLERFKPEQVARFGNNIIIYPSLNKKAYQSIISSTCLKYTKALEEISGIKFYIKQRVYDEIYVNSVYPSQGTRPVFTSINQIFGSSLSEAVLWCHEEGLTNVTVDLDCKNFEVIFSSGPCEKRIPVVLDIRLAKQNNSESFKTLIAVHEAGHAVVHAALLNVCPREIASNLSSFDGGYIISNELKISTKKDSLNEIAILLAGICAEQIVFGPDNRSTGCSGDITSATRKAAWFVRRYGFDGTIARIGESQENIFCCGNYDASNEVIENMLKEAKNQALQLLQDNRELFKETIKQILERDKLSQLDYYTIAKPFLPNLQEGEIEITTDYDKLFQQFVN